MEVLERIQTVLVDRPFIVGMGNDFRMDDAVGLHIVTSVLNLSKAGDYRAMNVDDVLENYVFQIAQSDCRHVFLIDAVETAGEPGSVIFDELKELDGIESASMTHKPGLRLAEEIFSRHGKKTWLLGIVVANTEYGTGISPVIMESARLIIDLIAQTINGKAKELSYVH